MSHKRLPVSRRDFLTNAGSGLGAIALHSLAEYPAWQAEAAPST